MDLWHNAMYKVGNFFVVVYQNILLYFHSALPYKCFTLRQNLHHSGSMQVRVHNMSGFDGYHNAFSSLSRKWWSRGDDSSCDLKFNVDVWHQSMYKADKFFVVLYANLWVHFHSVLAYECFNSKQNLYRSGWIHIGVHGMFCFLGIHHDLLQNYAHAHSAAFLDIGSRRISCRWSHVSDDYD